jgi:hypothetical protein
VATVELWEKPRWKWNGDLPREPVDATVENAPADATSVAQGFNHAGTNDWSNLEPQGAHVLDSFGA